MKTKMLAFLLLGASCMFAAPRVFVGVGVRVGGYYGPPRVAVYGPPCPGPGYYWVPGYWYYAGPHRLWRGGYWAAPRHPGRYYVTPRFHGHDYRHRDYDRRDYRHDHYRGPRGRRH